MSDVSPGESFAPIPKPSLGAFNGADLPTPAPQCETSSKSIDSLTVEQANVRVRALEAELDRLKAAATADLQSVQNLLLAETRKVNALKAELVRQAEESPEAMDAKELLILWRDTLRNGHKSTDIDLASDRGTAVLRSLKHPKRGKEGIRRAILGVQFDDWAMGRTSKQSRPYNDIAKHILHDSDRFEHFVGLYEKHHPEVQKPVEQAPQLTLVPSVQLSPLERVMERLPAVKWSSEEGVMSSCPVCDGGLFVRVLDRPSGELVLLDCYGRPACDRIEVMLAAGLRAGDMVSTPTVLNEFPGPFRLPEHLHVAMRRLLAVGVVDERGAA